MARTSGDLDRLVQFMRATTADDGFSSVETFAAHGDPVWAEKNDVSDGERWRADQVQASLTTRFMIRWSAFSAAITPADKLVCEGVTYDISGIKEGKGRRQWLEITAAARVD